MCIADYIITNADAYVMKHRREQDGYFAAVAIIGTMAHQIKPTCEKYTLHKAECWCDRKIRAEIIRHYRQHRLSMNKDCRVVMKMVKVLLKNRVPIIFNIAENMSISTLQRMADEDNFFESMVYRFRMMENG